MAPASKHQREASGSGDSCGDADAGKASKLAKSDNITSHAASLAGFADLPEELRSRIINLACYRQQKDEHIDDAIINNKWRVRLDLPTVAKLALVSRHFHSIYHPTLWAHVKLTRPSELAAFHRALAVEPKNGRLIKSLQLGHLADLPEGWWPSRWKEDEDNPICPDDAYPVFKTGLTKHDEALGRVPRWCRPGREFAYSLPLRTCQLRHAAEAIRTALLGVAVEDDDESYGFTDGRGSYLGIDEWTVRLFEAQGVVDLYLMQMRRIEDAEGRRLPSWRSKKGSEPKAKIPRDCRSGKCGHYPRLLLEGFEGAKRKTTSKQGIESAGKAKQGDGTSAGDGARSSGEPECGGVAAKSTAVVSEEAASLEPMDKEASTVKKKSDQPGGTVIVTRDQVKEHLLRPGAHTDSFEHPLIFARSPKLRMLTRDDHGYIAVNHSGDPDEDYYDTEDTENEEARALFGFDLNDSDLEGLFDSDSDASDERDSEGDCSSLASMDASSRGTASNSSSSSSSSPSLNVCTSETIKASTREGILALAHSVLLLTPKLQNLLLTGIFHKCFRRQLPVLQKLRFVSIGPLSPPNDMGLCMQNIKLPAMEKLRLCGDYLGRGTADQIGGKDGIWPMLRETQWDFGHKHIGINPEESFLMDLVNIVQGRERRQPAQPNDKQQDPSPSRQPARRETLQDDGKREGLPSRFVEARFHPAYLEAILSMAPSAEIRAAWMDGLPVHDAPHRVRLIQSQAARKPDAGYFDPDQDYEVFRRDSVQWWEERALELDRECEEERSASGRESQ